ncbi:MAG: hypothetical protein ACI8Y8_004039 [Planctomycetota bacterium]|jgi:hypothetical protein
MEMIAILIGGLITLASGYSLFGFSRSGRRVAPFPLVGGGRGGLLLCWGLLGFEGTRPYAWIALIVDYGTVAIVLAVPVLILDAWSTSSANVVHHFVSGSNGRSDDFRLFKRGKITIRSQHDPPSPDNEHGALIVSRGFLGTWTTAPERYLLEGTGKSGPANRGGRRQGDHDRGELSRGPTVSSGPTGRTAARAPESLLGIARGLRE